MTGRPIKWNSLFTGIHTKAKRDWLVSGQLKIELCNIIVNKLLHLLYYPYWNSKCKVEASWQLEVCAGSNIVLATYSTTSSDINSLSTTVDDMYTREWTFTLEQISCKLIPMSTSCMFVQYLILNQCCIQATIRWSNSSIFPSCSQFDSCLTGCNTHVEMLDTTCLKCTIINPFIYAHVSWNRNDDWNRLSIWTMECQLSNYPCILVWVVGKGEFHLFLLIQYRSDIKLIPLGLVCLLVCTLVPVEQDRTLTWQWSIDGQIYIEHIYTIYQW